jgi:LysM repeat protein
MMSAEIKHWLAVGAIFLLVVLFIGRMNNTPTDESIENPFLLETPSTNTINAPATPTYTLAFVDASTAPLTFDNANATTNPASPIQVNGIASTSAITTMPTATLPAINVASIANNGSNGQSHEVVRGETLFSIAQQYGVTVEQLMIENNLTDSDTIYADQVLRIPSDIGIILPTATQMSDMGVTATAIVIPADAIAIIGATPMPDLPELPDTMNGLAYDVFIDLSPETRANIRRVFTRGQMMGRNARSVTRIGDSTIEAPYFLTRFDEYGNYNLGAYRALENVIAYYSGSFGHESIAIRRGMHTWSVFDPLWADASACLPNEHVLACEIRRANPSIIFVRLGSNDAGVPDSTERNLRRVIEYNLEQGVIPIMGTKADRFEGSNINNEIIRRLAREYQVPLWDFDVVAGQIPGRGLGSDGVHMTSFFAHDWTSAEAWTRGHGVHNLSALIVLDAVWRSLQSVE